MDLLTQGCCYDVGEFLPAEKGVIAGWIWAGDQSVKDCEQLQSFNIRTIWNFLNEKFWNKFLTTLSISATTTSKVIEIKSCFEYMFQSVFSFHVQHPPLPGLS